MKKLLLSVIILLSVNVVFAQFEKKIASSNEEIQNEKKRTNPKTWISRAELFQKIYDEPVKNISQGMPQATVNLIFRNLTPIGNEVVKIGSTDYNVTVYSNIKLFYDGKGELYCWEVTKPLADNPLKTAYDAYKEAINLDSKQGIGNKKIKEGLINLSNQYKTEGSNEYQLERWNEALSNFKYSLECSSNPIVGITDSLLYYYAGLAANSAKDSITAEEMFTKAIQIGYTLNGDTYLWLAEVLRQNGKKAQALESLNTAMRNYPDNKQIILSLIDFYTREGDDPKKILPLLEQAKQAQPNNASLHYVEGTLYEKIAEKTGDREDLNKALESYKKSTQVSPDYFFGFYGLGAVYFNRAVSYLQEAEKVPINNAAEFERITKLADEQFELALEPMLKAHELNPAEKSVVQSIKDIYFRMRTKGQEYQDLYKKYNDMFQEMQ